MSYEKVMLTLAGVGGALMIWGVIQGLVTKSTATN